MKAGETTVLKLLQGSKVFLIPNFQRRYSWRAKEWELLWSDLRREYDIEYGEDLQALEGHFLGSIVLHPAAGAASVLMRHLVIDGQQRLTTVLILLAALRDVRSAVDPSWDPNEYNTKYLTNPYDRDQPDRLLPTELDRDAYVQTIRHGNAQGGIGQAYAFFARKLREEVKTPNFSLEKLGETLLLHMLLVEINTGTGDSVNNIFNTLNSKGMPLSAADLVRNELLLHTGEVKGSEAYHTYWLPMENALVQTTSTKFDDREFVTFLWSREVAEKPGTTRQELFPAFERRLRESLRNLPTAEREARAFQTFKEIYDDHRLFLIVRDPANVDLDDGRLSPSLRAALLRVRQWGSEPLTPLALWLLKNAVAGNIAESDAEAALDLLLGYLLRRALAGIPTNLLNRLITPLPSRLSVRRGNSVANDLRDTLSQPGYYWPSDEEVHAAVEGQPIYISAKRQTFFILSMLESLSAGKEQVDTHGLTVEHVMPQVLSPEWVTALSSNGASVDEARALTHTLGNLTLTGYNSEMGNDDFPTKKHEAFLSSPLKLNQELAHLETFEPSDIRARSHELASILLGRFPGPTRIEKGRRKEREEQSGSSPKARMEMALQSMPDGSWTTSSELVEFLGTEEQDARALVNGLEPVIARLVRESDGTIPTWINPGLRDAVSHQFTDVDPRGKMRSDTLGDLVREVENQTDEDQDDDVSSNDSEFSNGLI